MFSPVSSRPCSSLTALSAFLYFSSIRGEFKGRRSVPVLAGSGRFSTPSCAGVDLRRAVRGFAARLPKTDIPGAFPIYLLSGMAAWGLFLKFSRGA